MFVEVVFLTQIYPESVSSEGLDAVTVIFPLFILLPRVSYNSRVSPPARYINPDSELIKLKGLADTTVTKKKEKNRSEMFFITLELDFGMFEILQQN
jgi:hypothetical protein